MTTETDDRKNRSKAKSLPPIERLRELLIVDPTSPSGLRWKVGKHRAKIGQIAGSKYHRTPPKLHYYWKVAIDGVRYKTSRIIYAMHYGAFADDLQVDHINGDCRDNRAENLRLATASQNNMNTGLRRNNTSGVKGVSWCKLRSKWFAQIYVSGTNMRLGFFDDINDARRAREEAELRLHGEFSPLARKEGA